MIDGYDEAPSCSSFASGSFDIDVIFHVHCTKPVWCVTPGLAVGCTPDLITAWLSANIVAENTNSFWESRSYVASISPTALASNTVCSVSLPRW